MNTVLSIRSKPRTRWPTAVSGVDRGRWLGKRARLGPALLCTLPEHRRCPRKLHPIHSAPHRVVYTFLLVPRHGGAQASADAVKRGRHRELVGSGGSSLACGGRSWAGGPCAVLTPEG